MLKLAIKAGIVLTAAFFLCPFICQAKATWNGAQPRVQEERSRIEKVASGIGEFWKSTVGVQ